MSLTSSGSLTSFPLAPLPNVGLSCWFNSALQLMLSSLSLRTVIQRGKGTLHNLINDLIVAVSQQEQSVVVEKHKQLYDYVISQNKLFEASQACDAQDCLMWFIETLHNETAKVLPSYVLEKLTDPVSKAICSSYHNAVSSILENVLSCTIKTDASNKIVSCETYTILFVQPERISARHTSIQPAISKLRFGHLPTCLFITLIDNELQCAVNYDLVIHDQRYSLQSAIFFLRHNSHYVTAVRTIATEQNPYDWIVANDLNLHPLKAHEIDSFLQGYPTVFCYCKVA